MISTRHVDELTEERGFVQAFYLSAPRLPSVADVRIVHPCVRRAAWVDLVLMVGGQNTGHLALHMFENIRMLRRHLVQLQGIFFYIEQAPSFGALFATGTDV